MKPTRLPTLPRGVACQRFSVSRRNRLAAAWRSACAGLAALYTKVATVVAGH